MNRKRFEVELYGEDVTDQVEGFEISPPLKTVEINYLPQLIVPNREVVITLWDGNKIVTDLSRCKITVYN